MTVKNELAALRRAFNLAVRAGRLPHRPAFAVIEARNRRTGFFGRADFERVLSHLPAGVAALAEFLYWSGWRKGEALALEWRNVDTDGRRAPHRGLEARSSAAWRSA